MKEITTDSFGLFCCLFLFVRCLFLAFILQHGMKEKPSEKEQTTEASLGESFHRAAAGKYRAACW